MSRSDVAAGPAPRVRDRNPDARGRPRGYLVALLFLATTAAAVEVEPVVPHVRPGTWTAVRVTGAPPGRAFVAGGAGQTNWTSDGTPRVVPVLVPPDVEAAWHLAVSGPPDDRKGGATVATVEVAVLGLGDALVLDATRAGVTSATVEALAPGAAVARVSPDAPPLGLSAATAAVFDAEPPDAAAWLACGVAVAWDDGEGLRVLDPPGPALTAIEPWAYDAAQAWRPTRPPAERAAVVAVAAVVLALAVLLRRRPAVAFAVVICGAIGLVAWRASRPPLAVRTATVGADRWHFVAAPDRRDATPAVFAFVGHTLPIAFSPDHLARLSPTLSLDAAGRPATLAVNVPPGSTAAVVQRGVPADDAEPPAWSRPLRRRYR